MWTTFARLNSAVCIRNTISICIYKVQNFFQVITLALICQGSSAVLAIAVAGQVVVATTVSSAPSSPKATAALPSACYVTDYSAIPAATAVCTSITLDGITVPGNGTINLSKLKTGTKVTFSGTTFWDYFDANYPFIKVGGTEIEITATEGAVLDGNGQAWWDGLGSNGGVAK